MLQKQSTHLNFAQGLDTKTDPKQVQFGKFLALENSIFSEGGLLKKRNGNQALSSLPESASYVTTFNGELTTIGKSIQVLAQSTNTWVNKGAYEALGVDTQSIVRNNLNQNQSDTAISSTGLVCTTYTETTGAATSYKYVISDIGTGQNIVTPTTISAADATYGTPKVYLLEPYFVIIYAVNVAGNYHLVFIAISTLNPSVVTSQTDISTSYTPSTRTNFDAALLGSSLYIAWNGASASGVKMVKLTPQLALSNTRVLDASHQATLMTVCADATNQIVWASYYNSGTSAGYSVAVSPTLVIQTHFPTQIISTGTILNLASVADSGVATVFYEISNTASSIQTNYVSSVRVTQSSGVVSSPVIVIRSLGLASKAFLMNDQAYFLGVYSSSYQPTYFLVNGTVSTSASPTLVAKLAYENGAGYLSTGLPSVSVSGDQARVSYLFKDLIQSLSNANAAGTATVGGIYSQTGINLATFSFNTDGLITSEIGKNLNITGGFLWAYDGYALTEQGFHLYPDNVQSTANATTGGSLSAQIYIYQIVYEWSDNQGNIFRSAGSLPLTVNISGSGTSTNTITLVIPTLRVTAKVSNPVKITIYRWSTAQQTFYQTTSISTPTLNSTTTDSVTYVDTNSDASILGNSPLYTTGGVIEDVGPPASSVTTLFDDRLWLVDAEDKNLLWFSKQVIESTPVEMSDLLTMYVAPTIGAQGSTGDITALAALDDKLIIFKQDAIYYLNGTGPDNTGANNQYSQPIFITSTVGCSNPKSIAFIPSGLMFQSDKGIWLLGRDLSTQYIGASVEEFNGDLVLAALTIPGQNQVRFTLDGNVTLMYDYYYGQWGTFTGMPGISSTLYQSLHTYIDQYNRVFQESPGVYLDGTNPVLLSLETSWLSFAGIQGYQRAHFFYLLGQYFSPFKLTCQVSYDYVDSPIQSTEIHPTNYAPFYGAVNANGQTTTYGAESPYGGPGDLLNWRIFLTKQRCTSFKIKIKEYYDSTYGQAASQGLSLTGINLVYALKKGFRPISQAHSVGSL